MKNLQSYLLLALTIMPNVYLQGMIQDSDSDDEKPLYKLAELKWLPHGEKDVCDCPAEKQKLTRINVWNDFWGKIAKCLPKEKNEVLRKLFKDERFRWKYKCLRRFIAATVYAGANPNLQEHKNSGDRALGLAVDSQDYYLTKLLLEHNADPNLKVNYCSPALFFAENKKLAKLLLKYEANINGRGYNNNTPLHFLMNNVLINEIVTVDLVQLYIDKKAEVNAVDAYGDTPLHTLAEWHDKQHNDGQNALKKAQILLAAGADVKIKNQDGKTAIDILNDKIAECNNEIAKYSKGKCPVDPYSRSWTEEQREIAQILLNMLKSAKKQRVSKR